MSREDEKHHNHGNQPEEDERRVARILSRVLYELGQRVDNGNNQFRQHCEV